MSSNGIKDRVAIVGMSCTPFREHFDRGRDDLLIDAADEVLASVGVSKQDIDAYWMGMAISGSSGIVLASALKLQGKPVTRVENYCATGSEALRQAAYAVASGAYDIAMAIGCDKFKDTGFAGTNASLPPNDGTARTLTAAAMYSMILPAYAKKYGVDPAELRLAAAKIAEKNHRNGARNPLAQFRKETSAEDICKMAAVAGELSVFDCAGVADGAAAAIVVRSEDAHRYTDKPLFIKGMSVVAGDGSGLVDPSYDFTTFPEVVLAAEDAYQQAGVDDPRSQVAMAEVHDCFTPTELVLMEDLSLRRARYGVEGGPRRDVRTRRQPARQHRRRPEELRAPRWRLRLAHALRVLAPAARRGARGPAYRQRPQARRGAQSRGLPGRDGLVRVGRRYRAGLSSAE